MLFTLFFICFEDLSTVYENASSYHTDVPPQYYSTARCIYVLSVIPVLMQTFFNNLKERKRERKHGFELSSMLLISRTWADRYRVTPILFLIYVFGNLTGTGTGCLSVVRRAYISGGGPFSARWVKILHKEQGADCQC